MKSKFKVGLFFIVIPSMMGFVFLTMLLWTSIFKHPDRLNGVIIMILIFLTLASLILLREARFKWSKIEVTENELIIKPLFGLWTQRTRLTDVTGYTRSREHSKTSPGLAIYIYVRQRRVAEISDAYYKNISQIVAGLNRKVTRLGSEKSNMLRHFLNAFGVPIEFREK